MENNGVAADDADPDFDGLTNLLEYVAGTNPKTANTNAGTQPVFEMKSAGDYHALWLRLQSPARSDVTVSLEYSDAMAPGTWIPLSTRVGAGAWTGPVSMQNYKIENGVQTLLLVDGPPVNTARRRFYRLSVRE